jgi:cyclopropane fatty-acyl-phospholipid synthase-like methyltransferase
VNPLKDKIELNAKGLDFGCGHGPALADMLKKDKYSIDLYDPFFFPNKEIFKKKYDFITCTETAEHFFSPKKEFDLINSLLNKGGWFGVMTSFLTTNEAFDSWYYRRDPTHVVFYAEETFDVIAKQRNWHCEIITKDVVLFNKN